MTYELLDGTVVIADGSGLTPTTANQTLITIPIPENHFKYLLVHIDLEIAMVSSPVVQQIDLELINDATVVKTFNFSPGAVDVIGIWDYNIEFPVAKNNSGNIILQLGNAGAADVDTTIKTKGAWVAGIG
jgi:hypothetical protein